MSSREKAILCARQAADKKAIDVVLLDVSEVASFTDYFVICSGSSGRQVQGIVDNLLRQLRGQGIRPLSVEGQQQGQWVLVDLGDVIMHVFYEPVREVYDLESLWSDAKVIPVGTTAALTQ